MKSLILGKNTSPVEINITRFGLWLCLHAEEFFLAYEEYPHHFPLIAHFN